MGSKFALRSWTFVINLIALGLGIFYPGLSDEVRIAIITMSLTNISLRVRTSEQIRFIPRGKNEDRENPTI